MFHRDQVTRERARQGVVHLDRLPLGAVDHDEVAAVRRHVHVPGGSVDVGETLPCLDVERRHDGRVRVLGEDAASGGVADEGEGGRAARALESVFQRSARHLGRS